MRRSLQLEYATQTALEAWEALYTLAVQEHAEYGWRATAVMVLRFGALWMPCPCTPSQRHRARHALHSAAKYKNARGDTRKRCQAACLLSGLEYVEGYRWQNGKLELHCWLDIDGLVVDVALGRPYTPGRVPPGVAYIGVRLPAAFLAATPDDGRPILWAWHDGHWIPARCTTPVAP